MLFRSYCEEGFPLYFANHEMVKLLGYETFEELSEAIRGKVVNTIHPDDRQRVAADIGPRLSLIHIFKKAFSFDKMFAVIFLISAISLILMWAVELLQKKCMPWETSQKQK